jgi:ribosomal protein L37AE/L43A
LVGGKDDSRGRYERAVPPCPRCGTALNVRRSRRFEPGTWTCRFCRFEVWKRQVLHDRERVLAEAEEITKEAAA